MKNTKQILLFLFLLFNNISFSMEDGTNTFNLGENFVKFTKLEDEQMQIACKTYKTNLGGKITFLSAAHFAEKGLYEAHQKILDAADYVLFEGKGLDKEGLEFFKTELGKNIDLLSNFNLKVAHAYNLEYQWDNIDYNKNHFIHADVTFKELTQVIDINAKELDNIKDEYKNTDNPIDFFYNEEVENLKKCTFSRQFDELKEYCILSEDDLKNKLGKEYFENEFVKRNDIIKEKLSNLISQNSNAHIVIYYGAAHFLSLERDLRNIYQLMPLHQEWFTWIRRSHMRDAN